MGLCGHWPVRGMGQPGPSLVGGHSPPAGASEATVHRDCAPEVQECGAQHLCAVTGARCSALGGDQSHGGGQGAPYKWMVMTPLSRAVSPAPGWLFLCNWSIHFLLT